MTDMMKKFPEALGKKVDPRLVAAGIIPMPGLVDPIGFATVVVQLNQEIAHTGLQLAWDDYSAPMIWAPDDTLINQDAITEEIARKMYIFTHMPKGTYTWTEGQETVA